MFESFRLQVLIGLLIFTNVASVDGAHAKGGFDAGGGHAVVCDGKYYALDFRQTETRQTRLVPAIENAKSAKEILLIIAEALKNKIPSLAVSLIDFARFNENMFDNSTNRVWFYNKQGSKDTLVDPNDQKLLRNLDECKRPDGSLYIFPAVTRIQRGKIIYTADDNILEQLNNNHSAQLSFLYIHEWLRDYSADPIVIQNVNRLLHSEHWMTASGEELRANLKAYGLEISGRGAETASEQKARIAKAAAIDKENKAIQARVAQSHAKALQFTAQAKTLYDKWHADTRSDYAILEKSVDDPPAKASVAVKDARRRYLVASMSTLTELNQAISGVYRADDQETIADDLAIRSAVGRIEGLMSKLRMELYTIIPRTR